MGDVGSIYLTCTAYALSEVDQTEGESLYEEELGGIRLVFEDEEFMDFTDEDIVALVEDTAELFKENLCEVLLNMRDEFIEAAELADVYELYEDHDPDWEL